MKQYIEEEGLYDALVDLDMDHSLDVYVEDLENGIDTYTFYKTAFHGNEIILHDTLYKDVGLIQDSCGIFDFDDMVEGAYSDLTQDNEYKMYIEKDE